MQRWLALVMVTTVLTTAGCATIQHPDRPNVQYGSMERCMQHNPQSWQLCEKVLHQRATNEAVATGVGIAGALAWLGSIAYLLSILK